MFEYSYGYWQLKTLYKKSLSQIEGYQTELLQKLLEHACKHSAFYNALYGEKHIDISSIRSPQDITHLPILDKDIIRKHPQDIVCSNFDKEKLGHMFTSGSTGEPFTTYLSPEDEKLRHIRALYMYTSQGVSLLDRRVYFLISADGKPHHFLQKLGIFRSDVVQYSYDFNKTLDDLIATKANVIEGFPSFITLLAEKNRERKTPHQLKTVVTYGEYVTPEMRETINSSFGVDMKDVYGLTETGHIGYECKAHNGYHISPNFIVENVDGELVVTALKQKAMPVIRFRTGDWGEIDTTPCSCGLQSPRIINLQGRSGTIFLNKRNEKVPISHLFFSYKFRTEIYQFKLIQKEVGKLEIEVVLSKDVQAESFENTLREALNENYKDQFDYKLSIKRDIEKKQGKFCAMKSYVYDS